MTNSTRVTAVSLIACLGATSAIGALSENDSAINKKYAGEFQIGKFMPLHREANRKGEGYIQAHREEILPVVEKFNGGNDSERSTRRRLRPLFRNQVDLVTANNAHDISKVDGLSMDVFDRDPQTNLHGQEDAPRERDVFTPIIDSSSRPSAVDSSAPSQKSQSPPTNTGESNPPSAAVSDSPSFIPTLLPTEAPTSALSFIPSAEKSDVPSKAATVLPSSIPTFISTALPSKALSAPPSSEESDVPTLAASEPPSLIPTFAPSAIPSIAQSTTPSSGESDVPSMTASNVPSKMPTFIPTAPPSKVQSATPSLKESNVPTTAASGTPSRNPSYTPTTLPTADPTSEPTATPTFGPTSVPTLEPSREDPSDMPSSLPSQQFSNIPSIDPSSLPSILTTGMPTSDLSMIPSRYPSSVPSNVPSGLPSVSPSFEPSIDASNKPSLSLIESTNPQTTLPSSSYPSLPGSVVPSSSLSPSTEDTSNPSDLPTRIIRGSLDPPPNQSCQTGTSILLDPSVVTLGTTVNATVDQNYACASFNQGGINNLAPGVWYNVIGNGRIFEVDTCYSRTDFGTAIQVFEGNCDSLTCLKGKASVSHDSCDNSRASKVTWDSISGQLYQIYIFGRNADDAGNFGVSLRDFVPPPNNQCETSASILPNQDPVVGSTLDAPYEANVRCGQFNQGGVDNLSPAAWYTVVGNGRIFEASTCLPQTNFDTAIQILEGTCDALKCVPNGGVRTDPNCENALSSSLRWDAVEGQIYNVLVFGNNVRTSGRGDEATGVFGLSLRDFERPDNDSCPTARNVRPDGSVVFGSTKYSFSDANFRCGRFAREGVDNLASGLWFTITGTGGNFTASTCDNATTYATAIQVLSGTSCEGLSCVVGSDSDADCSTNFLSSTVTWQTTRDTVYYVLVFGRSSGTRGEFALSVTDTLFSGLPGTRAPIRAPTVSPTISPLPRMTFPPTRPTEPTTEYPTVILGNNMSIPTNGECFDAEPLLLDPSHVTLGSTVNVSTVDNFRCSSFNQGGVNNLSPGVWYTVVGNGRIFEASTCSEATTFGTAIQVFTGICGSLSCVQNAGSDSDSQCGVSALSSRIRWDTVRGQLYHIFVFGRNGGSSGSFGIRLMGLEAPPNDACEVSLSLPLNGDPLVGSTVQGSTEANFRCANFNQGGINNFAPGVWYTIVGTGRVFEVSTCDRATDFPTAIQVFSGVCDSLTCVQGPGSVGGSESDVGCESSRASRVRWEATLGELYHVFVFGRNAGDVGIFGIVARDMSRPDNNECTAAVSLPVNGQRRLTGSTNNGFVSTNYQCGRYNRGGVSNEAPGLYYVVVGNGNTFEVDTCSGSTDFATAIQVLSGPCESLTCIENAGSNVDLTCNNAFSSRVQWQTVVGQVYYIFAFGNVAGSVGRVSIQMNEIKTVP